VYRRDRIVAALHPAILSPRRGWVGTAIILGLFAVFGGIGIYEASIHHGTAPTAVSFEVNITNGAMTHSPLTVREGDQVVLSVTADRNDTLVLKGYNLRWTLANGVAAAITFVANSAGKYDFVLDSNGKKVGELDVSG
jgi:hypothetical protein